MHNGKQSSVVKTICVFLDTMTPLTTDIYRKIFIVDVFLRLWKNFKFLETVKYFLSLRESTIHVNVFKQILVQERRAHSNWDEMLNCSHSQIYSKSLKGKIKAAMGTRSFFRLCVRFNQDRFWVHVCFVSHNTQTHKMRTD